MSLKYSYIQTETIILVRLPFILNFLRFLFTSSRETQGRKQQKLTQSSIWQLLTTTFKDAKVFVGNVKNDRVSSSKIRASIATELAGTPNV